MRTPDTTAEKSERPALKFTLSRRNFLKGIPIELTALSYLTIDGMDDVLEFNFGGENRASSVLNTVFTYRDKEELENTPLLVVGDSSLVRPEGQKTSIGDLIVYHLQKNHLGTRPIYILARIGATIPDTLQILHNPRIQNFIKSLGTFDALVSVGPDIMKYVAQNYLTDIAKAEKGDIFAGLTLEAAAMAEIRTIGPGLTKVLSLLNMAERFTVLGAADYSNSDKIVMANENGTITGEFILKGNPVAKQEVKKASARMYEQIGNGTQDFADNNPDKSIQLVNLFDLGRELFSNDQHLNEKGRWNVVSRTLINWQLIVKYENALNLWTNRISRIND